MERSLLLSDEGGYYLAVSRATDDALYTSASSAASTHVDAMGPSCG